jgi:peptidoglycan/xylan/chitin deacetylase (PgdA/CDA1 family)
VVALTFDDGPTPDYTDSVLAILADRAVHATFYVIGKQVVEEPDLARRIAAAGHELGNHSYSHHPLESLVPGSVRAEVETTDSLIRAASYDGPITFRPPYGRRKFGLLWYLARTERTIVLWTFDPDTHNDRPDRIVGQALGHVRPGAIFLLHVEAPIRTASRAALPILIDSLRARGYRLVTVQELLRLH